MFEVVVASHNKHKVKEINDILKSLKLNIKIYSLSDFDINIEPIEDGNNFKENAFLKAKFYYDLIHKPIIADDSGLCIEYFNNFPGIYSARFYNYYHDPNQKLLEMMKYINNRRAFYNCTLCLYYGDTVYFEGLMNGFIDIEIKGNNGFGYDPIFIEENTMCNLGTLSSIEKNKYSHRFKALNKLGDYLEKNIL